MQRKVRINGLDPQRNNLPVKTLGDKQYKYPQYSANFYHEGGLIAGSTQKPRVNRGISDKNIGNILTKPNWDVKLQI